MRNEKEREQEKNKKKERSKTPSPNTSPAKAGQKSPAKMSPKGSPAKKWIIFLEDIFGRTKNGYSIKNQNEHFFFHNM